MTDRKNDGPDGPAFRAWLRDNDPESGTIRQEAAVVAARLDEVLQEPVATRATLEATLVTAMEHDVKQAKKDARYWADEATAEHAKREAIERMAVKFARKAKVYASITALAVVALLLWLMVRYG